MINPFKIYKELNEKYSDLKSMELETISSPTWNSEDETKAAILTIVKNPNVLIDPNLFAVTALASFGIPPDFEEFQIVLPEVINSFIELVETVTNKPATFSDDIKGYISVSCLEEGLWFLENRLKQFQEYLQTISEHVNGVRITNDDVAECEKLWNSYGKLPIEHIPEKDNEHFQVVYNAYIKNFTKAKILE